MKDKTGKVLSRSEGEAIMKSRASVVISICAAVLALCAMVGNSYSSRVLNGTLSSNDMWNFYQAKSIKQAVFEQTVADLEVQLLDPNLTNIQRTAITNKLAQTRITVERYESDPVSGEGKQELMTKAHKLEDERDAAKKKGAWFSAASTGLQIGIVLASSSILAVSMAFLWVGISAGCIGIALFLLGLLTNISWPL